MKVYASCGMQRREATNGFGWRIVEELVGGRVDVCDVEILLEVDGVVGSAVEGWQLVDGPFREPVSKIRRVGVCCDSCGCRRIVAGLPQPK